MVLVTQLVVTTNILADWSKCKRGTYKNEETDYRIDRKNSICAVSFEVHKK